MKDEPMNQMIHYAVDSLAMIDHVLIIRKPDGGRLVLSRQATKDLRDMLNRDAALLYHWLGAEAE